jgi:hypothetical protein
MKKNKIMMCTLAFAIASFSLVGCNDKVEEEVIGESKPTIVAENKSLGQAEETVEGVVDGVTYIPQPTIMYGSDFSTVMFNASLIDFSADDFKVSDILDALSAKIDNSTYMNDSYNGFTFQGFRITRGNDTLGYIELFEDGKPLEQDDFDLGKLDEYEFKGLFTNYIGNPDNAEETDESGNAVELSTYSKLIIFGDNIYCGNNKSGKGADGQGKGITNLMGNGYSTGTVTYYADENGFTIGIVYVNSVVKQIYFFKG